MLVGAVAGFVGGVTFNPGAATGIWMSFGITIGVGAFTGGASAGVSYGLNHALTPGSNWDWGQFAREVGFGVVIGAASAGVAAGLSRVAARSTSPLLRKIFGASDDFRDFAPASARSPGGWAKALSHKPGDVPVANWAAGVRRIVKDPHWIEGNPSGGLMKWGYIDDYLVRVVIGHKGIVTAHPFGKMINWYGG